jgi:hypothetical protein
MADTQQSPPETADRPITLYDQAKAAGFKPEEIAHLQPGQPGQPEQPGQTQQPEVSPPPEPPPQQPKLPDVPDAPNPVPGVYSPEKMQAALRAADAIPDPERRDRSSRS